MQKLIGHRQNPALGLRHEAKGVNRARWHADQATGGELAAAAIINHFPAAGFEHQQLENTRVGVRRYGPFILTGTSRDRFNMQEFRRYWLIALAIKGVTPDFSRSHHHPVRLNDLIAKCKSLRETPLTP